MTSPSKPKVVIVLGPPRSGSSLLTSMLISLGLTAGSNDELKAADANNLAGYYENKKILEINENLLTNTLTAQAAQIMERSGMSKEDIKVSQTDWNWAFNLMPLHDQMSLSKNIQSLLHLMQQQAVSTSLVTVWKDARFSYTLPIWERFIEPVCIVLWRDPDETSRSLEKASGIPAAIGKFLWIQISQAALKVSKNHSHLILSHRELIENPKQSINYILEFFKKNSIFLKSLNTNSAEARIIPELHRQRNPLPSDLERYKAASSNQLAQVNMLTTTIAQLQDKIHSAQELSKESLILNFLALISAVNFCQNHRQGLVSYVEQLETECRKRDEQIAQLQNVRKAIKLIPGFQFLYRIIKRFITH